MEQNYVKEYVKDSKVLILSRDSILYANYSSFPPISYLVISSYFEISYSGSTTGNVK